MHEKLLLVDDEDGIRNVLGFSLMDAGYDVVTASSVDDALRRFDERRPDIVLTDIKMPGKSGLDLLREVKARDRDVEVIMLTGHGDLELAIQSLKLDATDFLTKPVNDEVLEYSLKRARERIRMRRELREYAENLENMVQDKSARLVEAERQLAAMQVMDGLSSGLRSLSHTLADGEAVPEGLSAGEAADDLFNLLPCFVSVHSRDGRIVTVNRLFRERLGDLTGRESRTPYPSASDETPCPVEQVLSMGVGRRGNEILKDKQGRDLPVCVYAVPIYGNEGEVELVMELAVDSSEVRRLREELRQTRERYRQLFDESPSYVAVIDKNMQVLEANRRFREDFGDPEGRLCHELYPHRDAPCENCPAQRSFQDGLTHQNETVVTTLDGRKINVLLFTAPLRDAEGNISAIMEMSTNITELRSLQDHLSHLGLLLGSTAHGIKGLLTAIDGSIYRMGAGLKRNDPARVEDGFKDMRLLTGRLRKMVLDILYYAKDRGLAWEEVPVSGFAGEIADLVADKAKEMGVLLTCGAGVGHGLAEDLGMFEADTGSLSAGLVNILENAIEACAANPHPPAGGSEVRFSVSADNAEVLFTVTDNGMGMDQETREKLFTLFFSSKGRAGTGIGLFVASQMVKQHGGRIEVESEPGKGAIFTIVLPRRLPEEVVRKAPAKLE